MKRALTALGLPLLLAACGGTGEPVQRAPGVIGTPELTSEFTVENLQFGGIVYDGPVICDDRVTALRLDLRHLGDIQDVDLALRGVTGVDAGFGSITDVQVLDENDADGLISIAFRTQPGTAALAYPGTSVSPQAITVVPVPDPQVIGGTRVEVVARSATGVESEPFLTNLVPVVDNCPADVTPLS